MAIKSGVPYVVQNGYRTWLSLTSDTPWRSADGNSFTIQLVDTADANNEEQNPQISLISFDDLDASLFVEL